MNLQKHNIISEKSLKENSPPQTEDQNLNEIEHKHQDANDQQPAVTRKFSTYLSLRKFRIMKGLMKIHTEQPDHQRQH